MRIIIVDDDALVTASLKIILESEADFEVVGIGHDGSDAIELYKKFKADMVLMDIRMKDVSGLEASGEILKFDKNAKILLLTTFNDDEYIINAINLGVMGYLLKQDYDDLIPAIKAASKGQMVLGKYINTRLNSFIKGNNNDSTVEKTTGDNTDSEVFCDSKIDWSKYDISEKELLIIKCISEGKNNKEIAAELFLSEGTVRNYLSIILEKLQLRDRTQLAIFYIKNKTIE